MRQPLLLLVLAPLVTAGGCKKQEPPPPAASSTDEVVHAPPDRRTRCEQLADEAAAGTAIGLELTPLVRLDGKPSDTEARARAGEALVEQCLGWPEETLRCLSSPLAAFDDDCERRVAELTGQAVAPNDVPAGPDLAWRASLPSAARELRVTADGTALVLYERPANDAKTGGELELLALSSGEVVWHTRFEAGTRLTYADDMLLPWREAEISARGFATGEIRWRSSLPSEPGRLDPRIRAVTVGPSGWVVADDRARMFTISSSACPTNDVPCWTRLGEPAEPSFDPVDLLVHDDAVWVREYDTVRVFELSDLAPRFHARAHRRIGWIAPHPDGMAAMIDDAVLVFDPAKCVGTEQVAPSSRHRRAPSIDACPACPLPPSGCVKWQTHVQDLDPSPPTVLENGTIVVHDDRGFTIGLRRGDVVWRTATAALGPSLLHEDELLVLSTGFAEGQKMALRGLAIDDGRHRFETTLPFTVQDLVVSTADVLLAGAGGHVVVAHRQALVAVDLTQRD